jgi:ACR3 family arsenite efflux pump ArsB
MNGGWINLLLLSGLPILVLGVAMAGSFLKPDQRRWAERFVIVPVVTIAAVAYLANRLMAHDHNGTLISGAILIGLALNFAWVLFGRRTWAGLTKKHSGTGTSQ